MARGHIKTPKNVSCYVCGTVFLGKHYASKYCSKACEFKNVYAKDPTKRPKKHTTLLRLYGITLADYVDMEEAQEGKCALCLRKPKRLYVDHCHTTGKVRGLLCMNCNTGLGHFRDDPALLIKASEYLNIEQLKAAAQ